MRIWWILEAKGVFDKEVVEEIRSETRTLYQYSLNYKGDINDVYSEFLIKFISDEIKHNIKLTKLRYH